MIFLDSINDHEHYGKHYNQHNTYCTNLSKNTALNHLRKFISV